MVRFSLPFCKLSKGEWLHSVRNCTLQIMARRSAKHALFADAPRGFGRKSVLCRLTLHGASDFPPRSFRSFSSEKSVQKQAKTPLFAKRSLQSVVLLLNKESEAAEFTYWASTGCGIAFDLSPFLGSRVQKCHKEDLKRFWRVSPKGVCQQKRHLAYILSTRVKGTKRASEGTKCHFNGTFYVINLHKTRERRNFAL